MRPLFSIPHRESSYYPIWALRSSFPIFLKSDNTGSWVFKGQWQVLHEAIRKNISETVDISLHAASSAARNCRNVVATSGKSFLWVILTDCTIFHGISHGIFQLFYWLYSQKIPFLLPKIFLLVVYSKFHKPKSKRKIILACCPNLSS